MPKLEGLVQDLKVTEFTYSKGERKGQKGKRWVVTIDETEVSDFDDPPAEIKEAFQNNGRVYLEYSSGRFNNYTRNTAKATPGLMIKKFDAGGKEIKEKETPKRTKEEVVTDLNKLAKTTPSEDFKSADKVKTLDQIGAEAGKILETSIQVVKNVYKSQEIKFDPKLEGHLASVHFIAIQIARHPKVERCLRLKGGKDLESCLRED